MHTFVILFVRKPVSESSSLVARYITACAVWK